MSSCQLAALDGGNVARAWGWYGGDAFICWGTTGLDARGPWIQTASLNVHSWSAGRRLPCSSKRLAGFGAVAWGFTQIGHSVVWRYALGRKSVDPQVAAHSHGVYGQKVAASERGSLDRAPQSTRALSRPRERWSNGNAGHCIRPGRSVATRSSKGGIGDPVEGGC